MLHKYDRPLMLLLSRLHMYVEVILPKGEEVMGGGRWKIMLRQEIALTKQEC